jgi:predicted exporter
MTKGVYHFLRFSWIVLLLVLAGVSLKNNTIQFDLLALLPDSKTEKMVQVRHFMNDTDLSKQVMILVGHKDPKTAQQALEKLRHGIKISDIPLVENDAKATQQSYRNLFQALYPYKNGLLSAQNRNLLKEGKGAEIESQTLREISTPFSTFGPANLKDDPFFLFPQYVISLQDQNAFEQDPLTENIFITDNGKTWFIYHAYFTTDLFSLHAQKEFLEKLDPLLSTLKVDILKTGAVFYGAAGATQAQKEISFIGSISALLVVLLLFFVFRSFAPLGFALSVIASGLLGGISLAFLVYGPLHILALVFGGSLIGVCVDYALHYYCASLHIKDKTSPFGVLKNLMPALPLGVLSSCIGYGLLTIVPFPGIQQMALLAAGGLLSAFITVALWGPAFLIKSSQPVPPLAHNIQRALTTFLKNNRVAPKPILIAFFASFFVLFTVTFDDNVRHFQSLDPSLKAQEDAIKSKIQLSNAPTFFVISTPSLEKLLQKEEQITDQLDRLNISYKSLAKIIPSQKRQLENQQLIKENLVIPYGNDLFQKLGLTPLPSQQKNTELLKTVPSLPAPLKPLFQVSDGIYTGRILIQTPENTETLMKISKNIKDVYYIDPPEEYSSLFKTYRLLMIKIIGAVLGIIILLLALLKGPKSAIKITAPVLFSMLTTLCLLTILGIPITLFHLMGLLLVLCIGIDYALFLFWRKDTNENNFFLLANAMAALTTLFSFGLLAFSKTTAVQGFGLSVFIGITLSFIYTTLSLGRK